MIILEDVIHSNYKKARKQYLKDCKRYRMYELFIEVMVMLGIALFFIWVLTRCVIC